MSDFIAIISIGMILLLGLSVCSGLNRRRNRSYDVFITEFGDHDGKKLFYRPIEGCETILPCGHNERFGMYDGDNHLVCCVKCEFIQTLKTAQDDLEIIYGRAVCGDTEGVNERCSALNANIVKTLNLCGGKP